MSAQLAFRSRCFLAYRATVRCSQLFDPAGAARTAGWRWVLCAFVALDIVIWLGLRRSDGFAFKSRLALDAVDTAIWSTAVYPGQGATYDYAILIGVPLALEAGLRIGGWAIVVPSTNLLLTAGVRMLLERPVLPFGFGWQFMAVAGGVGTGVYYSMHCRHAIAEWAQRQSARNEAAFLGGQSSVAIGADTVVDGIQNLAALLPAKAPAASALHTLLCGYREALARETESRASYLGTALLAWQNDRARATPVVADWTQVRVPEGQGVFILTARQVQDLRRALDARALSGTVDVSLGDADARLRPPGYPVELLVGDERIVIPGDRSAPRRSPDAAPVIFLLGVLWVARSGASTAESVPLAALVLPLLGCLLAAAWSQRALLRAEGEVRGRIVAVGLATAAVHVVLGTLTMARPFKESGGQNFVFYSALTVPATLAGNYWRGIRRPHRMRIGVAVAAILLLGWILSATPRQGDQFLLALSWPTAAFVGWRGTEREFRVAARGFAEETMTTGRLAEDEAFDRGVASVFRFVDEAYHDVRTQLVQSAARLDPAVEKEARRRLEEVGRRLALIHGPDGSSSSMTTRSTASA